MQKINGVYSYSEFKKRTLDFHSVFAPGDTLAYGWIYKNIHITKRFNLLKSDGMKLVVEGYLADWGGLRRWLLWDVKEGSDSSDQIANRILKVLNDNKQVVERLSTLTLLEDLENAKDYLEKIFDSVSASEFRHNNKAAKFGVVAAGKLMHILFPNLCIIWDNKYVLDNGTYPRNGHGYYKYLQDQKGVLERVIESAGEKTNRRSVIRKIEREHSDFLSQKGFEDIEEPVTKLLDECNFS